VGHPAFVWGGFLKEQFLYEVTTKVSPGIFFGRGLEEE
jgi:hypothetical protein